MNYVFRPMHYKRMHFEDQDRTDADNDGSDDELFNVDTDAPTSRTPLRLGKQPIAIIRLGGKYVLPLLPLRHSCKRIRATGLILALDDGKTIVADSPDG